MNAPRLILSLLSSQLILINAQQYCDDCHVDRANEAAISANKKDVRCYPGKEQCAFDNPYVLFNDPADKLHVYSHDEAKELCHLYGTELASLYPHLTPHRDVPAGKTLYQQLRYMQKLCESESVGHKNCWIGGERHHDEDHSDTWLFYNH
eukprot:311592_1